MNQLKSIFIFVAIILGIIVLGSVMIIKGYYAAGSMLIGSIVFIFLIIVFLGMIIFRKRSVPAPVVPTPPGTAGATPTSTAAPAAGVTDLPWWQLLVFKATKHWIVTILITIFGVWIILKVMTWFAPSVSHDTTEVIQSTVYTIGNTWTSGKQIQDSIEQKEKERIGEYVPKTVGGKDDVSMDGNTTIHNITLHRGKKYGPIMIQNSNIGLRAIGAELWCSQGELILKKGDQAPSNGAKWQSGEWYFSAEKYFIKYPAIKTYSFTLRLTPQ